MRRRNKRLIRILAVVLAALLAGGVVFSALYSTLAESAQRDRYEISVEYMQEEQALRIGQRLLYVNRSADRLDRVCFYAAGNVFRRESALFYESGDLAAVFPAGYAPGGIDLQSVRFGGAEADYGFEGESETVLRVACDLAPGGTGEFEFEYYLLLTKCAAFQGAGDEDVRLSAFCLIPGVYDETYGEFRLNAPLAHTRWLHTGAADYEVTLTVPRNCAVAATGDEAPAGTANGVSTTEHTEDTERNGRRQCSSVTPQGPTGCVQTSRNTAPPFALVPLPCVPCVPWLPRRSAVRRCPTSVYSVCSVVPMSFRRSPSVDAQGMDGLEGKLPGCTGERNVWSDAKWTQSGF